MKLSDFAGKGGEGMWLRRGAGGEPRRYTFMATIDAKVLLYDLAAAASIVLSPDDLEPVPAYLSRNEGFPALVAKLAHAAEMDLFDGDEDGVDREYWEAWDYQLVKFAQLLLEAHGIETRATVDESPALSPAHDDLP